MGPRLLLRHGIRSCTTAVPSRLRIPFLNWEHFMHRQGASGHCVRSARSSHCWVRLNLEELEARLTPTNLPAGFTETLFAGGLSAPTSMAFAPDGRLFVSQQGGELRVIANGQLLPTPFLSLTTDSAGERGLLGVAFDPHFASNHFVYVYYTVPTSPEHNRVSRFTANG